MSNNSTARPGHPNEQQRQRFVGAQLEQSVDNQPSRQPKIARLGEPIDKNNKGFELLQKMGYKPGTSLGKQGNGRTEPVPTVLKFNRHGIGLESAQSEGTRRRSNMYPNKTWKKPEKQDDVQRTTVTIPKPFATNETITVDLLLPTGLLESCTVTSFGTISKQSKAELKRAIKMFEKTDMYMGMKPKEKIARRHAILQELGRRALMLAKPTDGNDLSNQIPEAKKPKLINPFVAEVGKRGKKQTESTQTEQLPNEEFLLPEVIIMAKNFPCRLLVEEDVKNILKEIHKRIDNVKPGDTIPLLKKYILRDGALHYSCANSETCKWLIEAINGMKLNNLHELKALSADDCQQSIKVCLTTQDVATEDSGMLLFRMNILNPGLIVKPWKVISRQNLCTKQKFTFLIDLESAKKIQENNFMAFTGIDKGTFRIVDDDDFGEVRPEREVAGRNNDQETVKNKETDTTNIPQEVADGNINRNVQMTGNCSTENEVTVNKEAEPMDSQNITNNTKPEEIKIHDVKNEVTAEELSKDIIKELIDEQNIKKNVVKKEDVLMTAEERVNNSVVIKREVIEECN
ncbi:hypothetical protein C0J52_08269 [Blattella germanica]|nr:hypothetical protein C0J52_08269 [Blattella germanica]